MEDRFNIDPNIRQEFSEVVSWVQGQRSVHHIRRAPHQHFNNTWSILEAYKDAYYAGYDRVYLMEDDVFVFEDFFEWHAQVQQKECFVSCAGRLHDSLDYRDVIAWETSVGASSIEGSGDPASIASLIIFSKYAYSSAAGVCFPRSSLALITEKLATKAFYEWIDQDHATQQDKEIQKLMWSAGGRSLWPVVPRALHEGWYGTGCTIAPPPSGTLNERVQFVRKVLSGEQQVNSDPKWGHDIVPVESWKR